MEDKCILGKLRVYNQGGWGGGGVVAPLSLRKAQQDRIKNKEPTTDE